MKKILLVLIFTPIILFGQPKPPSKPSSNPSSNELFGTAQNNIMGAQAKSFGGGSIIKPNPMLTSADIAFIGSNTYDPDQPLFRLGAGLGYGKNNKNSGYGANAILTFDLSQQSYSAYYHKKNWYYHFNFGSMGSTKNVGMSVTKVFKSDIVNTGIQFGTSVLEDHKYIYFIMVPYAVLMINKEIQVSGSNALILGVTFKENCPDVRNTKVIDIYKELKSFEVEVDIYDPVANIDEVKHEYNINIVNLIVVLLLN